MRERIGLNKVQAPGGSATGSVPGAGANGNRLWREELFHWDTVSMAAVLLLTFIADFYC
jgi:hypothetical protein